jgi:hypothetical protein
MKQKRRVLMEATVRRILSCTPVAPGVSLQIDSRWRMVGLMNSQPPFSAEQLRQKIRETVESGDNVRRRVERQVAETLHHTELDAEGRRRLAEAVFEGAREGYEKSGKGSDPNRLREVIDGLADGLNAAANAIQFTVEEARASGRQFAERDLQRARDDLRAIKDLFMETIGTATRSASDEFTTQWKQLGQHAVQAWDRVQPAIQSAVESVAAHPIDTGREAIKAGVSAATHAAGTLFSEVGRRLQTLGDKFRS